MKNWWTVEPDKFALLDRHHTKGRGGAAIQYVTRHHIMGALTTEQTRNVWLTRQASAHYVVENSGQIGQIIYDRDTAWSNGNAASNRVSVSIEHANSGGGPDWPISPTVIREGAKLAASLCWFYKLGRPAFGRNIRDHQEFTATACPQHLRNGGRYHSEWMRIAQEHYDFMAANPNGAPAPAPIPEEGFLMALNDAEQRELLNKVRDIHAQLGPWPQLGTNDKGQNLTLVDAVADSRRKAGHNKEA